jgi:hypothetical protein
MVTLLAEAQGTSEANLPRFEDYPASKIFQGEPATPLFATSEQRLYRTRIREGTAFGIGAESDGNVLPGPVNFAGHYIIITFGCGSPCTLMAIVDALTGKIYNSPMASDLQMSTLGGGPWLPAVEYRQNSKLMIMRPCPALAPGPVYTHYFVWEGNRWSLVRKVPGDGGFWRNHRAGQ